MTAFILNKTSKGNIARSKDIGRVLHELESLDEEKSWRVTVEEQKSRRTLSQNALLWQLYTDILRRGGEQMRDWTKNELHEVFLMHHFGEERVKIFGRTKVRPLRRSSRLTKTEFSEFVESIYRFMAEQGVVL